MGNTTRGGRWGALAVLLLAACTGACAPAAARDGAADAPRRVGDGMLLGADQLRDEPGSLLGVLTRRITGMQVQASAHCPEITLRGRSSLLGSSDPGIYVDGTPAVNTCILETMNPNDVERVEVYPMGVAPHAGYRNHPNGLILVFTRRE